MNLEGSINNIASIFYQNPTQDYHLKTALGAFADAIRREKSAPSNCPNCDIRYPSKMRLESCWTRPAATTDGRCATSWHGVPCLEGCYAKKQTPELPPIVWVKVEEIRNRYMKWLKRSGITAEDAQFMTDIHDLAHLCLSTRAK